MNYIYSFIIFEAGAFFGFFVAALLNAARAGQEITIKFEEEDNGTDREHLVGAENCAGAVSGHYIDDDESGRFFDRSAYSRMMDDVENGKIGVCIMKDLTRWGRDYLQVGNAMEIFRRNNVRFIAVNNGIDSESPTHWSLRPLSTSCRSGTQRTSARK